MAPSRLRTAQPVRWPRSRARMTGVGGMPPASASIGTGATTLASTSAFVRVWVAMIVSSSQGHRGEGGGGELPGTPPPPVSKREVISFSPIDHVLADAGDRRTGEHAFRLQHRRPQRFDQPADLLEGEHAQ